MPLQIRRGTAAERTGLTTPLVIGELLYVTDQGRLYIGDGTNLGAADSAGNPSQGGKGLSITGFTAEDAQDAAAILFSNGTHTNIIFTYNDGADALSAQIDLSTYTGNITVVNGIVDADFRGSVFADNSTLLVDAVNGSIPYAVLNGAPSQVSQFANDVGYITVADIADGTVTIDVNNTGDLQGSVFGDDSTLLVDATNSTIPASVVTGTFAGNVTGDVVGVVTGQSGSSLVGNVTGNVIGNVVGDVTGSIVTNSINATVPQTFVVTAVANPGTQPPANIFQIDGVNNPVLTLVRGGVYTFDQSAQFNTNHQIAFRLADGITSFTTGVVTTGTAGTAGAQTVFTVPANAPSGLVYYCTTHGNGMGNTIAVTTGSTIIVAAPINLQTSVDIDGSVRIFEGLEVVAPNAFSNAMTLNSTFDTPEANPLVFRRARGTPQSPSAVQTNDLLGAVFFNAFNGSSFDPAASITAAVDDISSAVVSPALRINVRQPFSAGGLLAGLIKITHNKVEVFARLPTEIPILLSSFHDDAGDASNFVMNRARGTIASPTAVQNGDPVFDIVFRAFDGNVAGTVGGSNTRLVALIRASIDGAVSAGITPGRLDFNLANLSGVNTAVLRLTNDKVVHADKIGGLSNPYTEFTQMPVLPTYADETAADAAIGGSANRINGMMYYDSGSSAVKAVVGGSWSSL